VLSCGFELPMPIETLVCANSAIAASAIIYPASEEW
jgi:hypothetical protein